MIRVDDKSRCCGCLVCVSACPTNCIDVVVDSEGFSYPSVDPERCVGCNSCMRACPFLVKDGSAHVMSAHAIRSRSEQTRYESSSGGVFTELSRSVINENGVVYGVIMNDDCKSCSFARAESLKETAPMRGSKYLQADSSGVFELVQADLDAGRRVLFTGTPCQTNGLHQYLGKNREGLLLVDCVCHGVPSPRLWKEHVENLEARTRSHVLAVNFRCKDTHRKGIHYEKPNNARILFKSIDESSYMKMFLSDCCLRPSCYECAAKKARFADLTIADFWGIGEVVPDMQDDLGCSLVIVRTDNGRRALTEIDSSIECAEVRYEDAVKHNPSEYSSAVFPREREGFYNDLELSGYSVVASRYGRSSSYSLIRQMVKSMLTRLGLLGIFRRVCGKASNTLRYGVCYILGD